MMKKKQFQSESKRLLDLMIHSIYTNQEIFLRELVSNASDALDKLYYRSLTDKEISVKKKDLEIQLKVDSEKRTLTISDNGCGMTKEELEHNLGTIAKSGTLAFKELNDEEIKKKKIDVIGQFGVGFYSAFMVSDSIRVTSKSVDSDDAYCWYSEGADGYTIEPDSKKERGTEITLHIKDGEEYDCYLEAYQIKELIKKYSDYVHYPIKMEKETLNTMIPLWKRKKKDVKEEDYNNFYQDRFYDYEKPLKVIHFSVEGLCSYDSLLFIPSHAPYDFYSKEYEKGPSLYSNGILIMDRCADLLPDYFNFVRGVVDTLDISLNISREMLQQTKSVSLIAKSIESKIKKELEDLLKQDRATYEQFYKAFGIQLKFGVYNNYGRDKEKLKDLLLFYSSKEKKLVSLKEYIANRKEDQKEIYYVCGESIDKIDALPQVEKVKEKDYEILYFTDYVDEFAIQALMNYDGCTFMNISSDAFHLESKEEQEAIEKKNEKHKDMFETMIKAVPDLTEIRFTNQLKNHPVCLTTKGNISIEMEKVINAMPTDEKIKAEMILEINESHPIAKKLEELYQKDHEELLKYTKILYSEARLIEGLSLENPTELSNLICDVISK